MKGKTQLDPVLVVQELGILCSRETKPTEEAAPRLVAERKTKTFMIVTD